MTVNGNSKVNVYNSEEIEKNVIPQWKVTPRFLNSIAEELYGQPWEQIFGRGTVQNSVDAKAKNISFIFIEEENSITCIDDGTGMTAEILLDKFLGVGETTKDKSSGQTIGGFGIESCGILAGAKYFHVKTNNILLTFENGDFQPLKYLDTEHSIKGTEIKIIRNKKIDITRLLKILRSNHLHKNISLNGEGVKDFPNHGKKHESEIGLVYYNSLGQEIQFFLRQGLDKELINFVPNDLRDISYIGSIIVRYKGLTQFIDSRYYLRGTVIVELGSNDLLTANREALKEPYTSKLNNIIDLIRVNKRAIETKKDDYDKFSTDKETPVIRRKGYPVTINIDNKRNQKLVTAWKHVCETILSMEVVEEKYTYGFIFDSANALIDPKNYIMYVNPKGLRLGDRSLLLKLIKRACHEITHITEDSHDEDFTRKFGALLEDCFEAYYDKEFDFVKQELKETIEDEENGNNEYKEL